MLFRKDSSSPRMTEQIQSYVFRGKLPSGALPQASHYAPINVKPAGGGQGMGWGFDCLCCP